MSLGVLVVNGNKKATTPRGPKEMRGGKKKDKFCSHHYRKKYHLLKSLHFIVATEESGVEWRET